MEYEYSPLDTAKQELRLLVLEPTTPSTHELRFQVQHTSLHDSQLPSYNAISYRWGQLSELSTIFLDGRPVQVPLTAADALRGAHNAAPPIDRHDSAIYWIDVVCINQNNLDEKSSQVALMGEIYRRAGRTLVWLGLAEEFEPSLVFGHIERFNQYIREATEDFETLDDHLWIKHHEDHRRFRSTDLAISPNLDWRPIYRFFARHWFRRLWCVQEVALAQAALCCWADASIDFGQVCLAARWLVSATNWPQSMSIYDVDHSGSTGIDNAACMWDQWKGRLAPKLDMLLYTTYWFETSDPLDKVYGLLGIWQTRAGVHVAEKPEHVALLQPDYRKTTAQVFAQASRAAIIVSGDLIMLDVTDCGRTNVTAASEIPSWAPRLDLGFSLRHSPNKLYTQSVGASDGIAAEIASETAWDVLSVRGLTVDKVMAVHRVPDRNALEPTDLSPFCDMFKWMVDQMDDRLAVVAGQSIYNILTAGSMGGDGDPKSKESFISVLHSFCESCKDQSDRCIGHTESLYESTRHQPHVKSFLDTLTYFCRARAVLSTEHRYAGIANCNVRPGDEVSIVFGSKKPVILRPSGGDRWQFVALAYIDGVMDGEYIKDLRDRGRLENEMRWFDIR